MHIYELTLFSVCVCFVILEVHYDYKRTPADLSAS